MSGIQASDICQDICQVADTTWQISWQISNTTDKLEHLGIYMYIILSTEKVPEVW